MEGASDEARREPLAAGTRDDATACAREEERPPPPAAPAARAASAPMPGPVAADAGAESEDSEYDFDAEGFAFPFDECSTVPFGTLCAQTPFAISPAQAYQRALALARVDDRDTVVDLGCGDGAVLLARAWPPARERARPADQPARVTREPSRTAAGRVNIHAAVQYGVYRFRRPQPRRGSRHRRRQRTLPRLRALCAASVTVVQAAPAGLPSSHAQCCALMCGCWHRRPRPGH